MAKKNQSTGVEYTLYCDEEDTRPEECFTDTELLAWVKGKIERGNNWGWFCAVVKASVEVNGETYEGTAYLGCCSYESEKDFRESEFETLKVEALAELKAELVTAVKRGDIAKAALRMPWGSK